MNIIYQTLLEDLQKILPTIATNAVCATDIGSAEARLARILPSAIDQKQGVLRVHAADTDLGKPRAARDHEAGAFWMACSNPVAVTTTVSSVRGLIRLRQYPAAGNGATYQCVQSAG